MTRRTALAGAALLAVLGLAVPLARTVAPAPAAPEPPAGAAGHPQPAPAATDPADAPPRGGVTWAPGPWGDVVVAGHRLLVPASAQHGPLRDRGDGWASDYPATATGAAIALLRGPWFVFAAPRPLRAQVVAAVLTPAAAEEPGPVNPRPTWAMPAELLAGFADQRVRLLGAVATLTGPGRARVDVFHERVTPTGPVIIRSTHHLVHADRQWRVEADYSDGTGTHLPADQLPARFTVTAPGARS